MKRVKNSLNYSEFPFYGEVNDEASMTQPEQSMSAREILVRSARGLPTTGARQTYFDGEEPDFENMLPDVNRIDLADAETLADWAAEKIIENEKALQEAAKEAKKKKEVKQMTLDQKDDQGEQPGSPKSPEGAPPIS